MALLALTVTVIVAAVDRYKVVDEVSATQTAYGWPANWLYQDQSALDSPYPRSARLALPQEHPIDVQLWPFILDVSAAGLAIGVALLVWRAGRTRRS